MESSDVHRRQSRKRKCFLIARDKQLARSCLFLNTLKVLRGATTVQKSPKPLFLASRHDFQLSQISLFGKFRLSHRHSGDTRAWNGTLSNEEASGSFWQREEQEISRDERERVENAR